MYTTVPSEYADWKNKRPKEIRLFRGDLVGLENIGISSGILRKGFCVDIHGILLQEDHHRLRMIDKHLGSSLNSPLISTTLNPQMAQVFATREGTTIYELVVPSNRVILEDRNMGKCGESGEILVVGKIEPDWIKRIKKSNTDMESELLDLNTDTIHTFPHVPSKKLVGI